MEGRLEVMEGRLEAMEGRLEGMEGRRVERPHPGVGFPHLPSKENDKRIRENGEPALNVHTYYTMIHLYYT
jgi:hypothetical protein